MKLSLPFFVFLSFLSLSWALPVDIEKLPLYQLRDDISPAPVSPLEFEKRELFLLTQLFKGLNNTAGVSLIKGACQVSLTQQQIIKFVANLIEKKGLDTLLKTADDSGLALDLVLLILTHYETVPGLTAIVKKYKGTATSSGSGSGTSGSGTSTGLSSTTGSSSSGSSGSGGLLGTVGNIVGGIVGGIGSIFGLSSGTTGSSGSSGSSTTARTTAAATTARTGTATGLATGTATGTLTLSTGTTTTVATGTARTGVTTGTTTPGTGAAATTGTPATGTTTRATTTSTRASTTTAATDPISSILGIVGGLFGINKRDEIASLLSNDEFLAALRESGIPVDELLQNFQQEFQKRSLDTEEDRELAKRDALDLIYSQIIGIIGTNSNIEDIAESLQKSGLAINVIYNALTDSGWYDFDVNLVKYLTSNNYISLLSLGSALWSSGVIFSVAGDILGNSAYTRLVIQFVLAILSGSVPVIALITALF